MFGSSAHPIFLERLKPVRQYPLLSRVRKPLGLLNSSYYFKGSFGLETKVYLTNYYNLLCDAGVPASWYLECLDRQGKVALQLQGTFKDNETVIIDLAPYKQLDAFGVVRAQVVMQSDEVFLPQAHSTDFFNEYYQPGSTIGIMAHSLHVARAAHGEPYQRISPGLVVPSAFHPHLLIAGGCNFSKFLHGACTKAKLTFLNFKNEEISKDIEPLKPGACHMIDLFKEIPQLAEHISDKPFTIKILGENFLPKPFMLFSDGEQMFGEHL